MGVKSRRDEYAEATHSAILEAAIERFTVDGYAKASIDAVAEAARVSKGSVYHHFNDKAELFETAFVVMEERLLSELTSALAGIEDPWELIGTGVDVFLSECCRPDFRRIALEEAPGALGWSHWKEIEERYFLGLVRASLDGLARAGQIDIPAGDLTARMFLAAMTEAGLFVATATNPQSACKPVGKLLLRLLEGLR